MMERLMRPPRLGIAGLWTLIIVGLCALADAGPEGEVREDAVITIQKLG
jgi:hypothetical protein